MVYTVYQCQMKYLNCYIFKNGTLGFILRIGYKPTLCGLSGKFDKNVFWTFGFKVLS